MELLKVEGLHVYYGAIHALKGVSLTVNEGEIVSLIGANGAGKTTLMSAIMNQIPSSDGTVTFMGTPNRGRKTKDIVRAGMTLVPEGRNVFPRTNVQDNLLLGAYFRKDKEEIRKDLQKMYEMFPRMLLMDEPSMGLAPIIVDQVFETIVRINESGTTILLVEQNANQALRIAKRGYVIETGEVVLEDDAGSLMQNERVREAYLGA